MKEACEECDVKNCPNTATFKIPKQNRFLGAKFCTSHAKAVKIILKSIGNASYEDVRDV